MIDLIWRYCIISLIKQPQTLPGEIEKMLIKPEISGQLTRNITANLTPIVERYVKETISKTLIPAYQAQSTAMHQDLQREIRSEVMGLKKEILTWQTEALRTQEVSITGELLIHFKLNNVIVPNP